MNSNDRCMNNRAIKQKIYDLLKEIIKLVGQLK